MNLDPRTLVLLVLMLVIVLIGRWMRARPEEPAGPRIPAWMLPLGAALLAGAITTWVWGGLHGVAVIHDESAYLLQADLLARGNWSLPSPPVSQAFTQAAVLVTPVLAPKMPPGHAMLLALGVAIGLPGLVPILLVGLTGGLIVVLVRRIASSSVAALSFAIWLNQAGQMRWRASYMSQASTGALWLLGWWLLLRWRETRRSSWLVALAGAAGLGAITRPLTMLAWAIPVGLVVLHDVIRTREWKALGAALATGTACLMMLPLQNHAILHDWRKSPLTLYTRQYIPFDVIGFGLVTTPPLLEQPPDLERAMESFRALHREHTAAHLPAELTARLNVLRLQTSLQWRLIWIPAFIAGLLLLSGSGWFALLSGLGLYLAYLLYAHDPGWTAYYVEMTPTVALVCAVGTAWAMARAAGMKALPPSLGLATAVCVIGVGWKDLDNSRVARSGAQGPYRHFLERVAGAHAPRALVFVRYDESADPHMSYVRNVADREQAPIVTAYDLDPVRNDSIMAAFPDRPAFLWDQHTDQLTPLQRAAGPGRAP